MREAWEFEQNHNGGGEPIPYSYSVFAGNEPIAEAYTEDFARLIAAVPDMLETLKAIGLVLGERPDDDELFAAFSRVINTITKAEGQS